MQGWTLIFTDRTSSYCNRTKLQPTSADSDAPDGKKPAAILLATGSEVQLALGSRRVLAARGIAVRVVSMPGWERFRQQLQASAALSAP